jgi:hypothetical protein
MNGKMTVLIQPPLLHKASHNGLSFLLLKDFSSVFFHGVLTVLYNFLSSAGDQTQDLQILGKCFTTEL